MTKIQFSWLQALLKASFLAGQSELMFVPSTHTRSTSLRSMVTPRLLSAFLFITSFVFLRASSTSFLASLILWTNSSTSSMLSLVHGCLGVFQDSRRTVISQYLNVVCCYVWTRLSVATWPSCLVGSQHTTQGIVPFLGWLSLFGRQFGSDGHWWISLNS